MQDLLPSTRQPLHPSRSQTSIKRHHRIPPEMANPFKFAHLSRDVSCMFGSHNITSGMMNPVGNLITAAIAMLASLR
jgi:hypothetical protein